MKKFAVEARIALCETYLQKAKTAERRKQRDESWQFLKYAHIAAQPMVKQHLKVHLYMFLLALRETNSREILGQLLRLLIAAPGSLSGRYPIGNPGTSDVSMFAVCDVPSDLKILLDCDLE